MSAGDDDEQFEKTNIFSSNTKEIDVSSGLQIPPCLVLLVGPADLMGRQWILNKTELLLGRNPTADIHLAEASLSKMHARIHFSNNKATITDLGSTNKTLVENQALTPNVAHPLKNNDQIRAGGLVFKFLEQGIVSETVEKGRMETELAKARTLQASLFPVHPEVSYEWLQVGGAYRSATEIGGDWWWHWSCGGKVFALVGDATGHGASAGLITSAARSAVATIEDDPELTIERAYAVLTKAIQKCSGGRMAMSAFIVEIDLQSRALRYINASHLAAILLPKDAKDLSWKSLESLGDPVSSPLGTGLAKVSVGQCLVNEGARLVLVTDGLTERKTIAGEPISERAFGTMLIHAHTANLDSLHGFLASLMEQSDKASSSTLEDDITVVALDL
ncbi:MAG TPA: SpoIIE family protein phosphatase [Bdellovibrionales bacterium]|nr:SpoIIE family protein phosphatase [Bdellovibrionales bacterium]